MNASILYAVLNSLVGLGLGFYVSKGASGEGWNYFPLFSTLASFITSFCIYFFCIEKWGMKIPFWVLAFLVVFLSHYFTFYFQFVYANFSNTVLGNFSSSLGEPPANLLQAIPASFKFTVISLFLLGWISVPIGILISYFFRK
jgi:hypothetical protein